MCLQIIIHTDNDITLDFIQAGHDCIVLSGITGQFYDTDTVIFACQRMQFTQCLAVIRRGVIHQNEFKRGPAQLLQFRGCQLNDLTDRMR